VRVARFQLLTKALRPLPDKWHGVTDVEIRYRQRYLDLIANPESRKIFLQRSQVTREIREFLHQRGFIEVETPMMQAIAGGAAAQPFQTYHNALSIDLYLRIAIELYLKRLLVAGFPKVFEMNRNFRNEGISRRHNPEFTMLEVYWAYIDFQKMAELVEELICHLAETVIGTLNIEHRNDDGTVRRTIHLQRPWRRARYTDLIRAIDPGWFERSREAKIAKCRELGVEIQPAMQEFEITQQVFEKLIEEKTIDPLFVTHLPTELVPLAKQNSANSAEVDVFELIINGQEIAPGYSELNDPIVQRQRLLEQAGEETQKVDEDFLLALEYGMPPAGGVGIGIDRLMMLLTGAESIRDVILFPHLKPKGQE
jgi:lysyl-tRNA synthetase class 2